MQFMMIFTEPDEKFTERTHPELSGPYWGAWTSYIQALFASGIVVNGHGLQGPHSATTLRVREGRREIQDGPFAETKDRVAGYFVIEVPDLDTALDWAAKAPCAEYAGVELRPILQMSPG